MNLVWIADDQDYLERLKRDVPELPWETVTRISEQYGVPKRELETLMGLDEYHAAGINYFEEITQGDVKLGKRALNWYVLTA